MRYRCNLCPGVLPTDPGFEFEVGDKEKPRCPKCESTESSGAICEVVAIHFEPPMRPELRGKKGSGKIACDGSPAGRTMSTGNTSVVNCRECLATQIWYDEAHATGLKAGHKEVSFQDEFFYRTAPTAAKTTTEQAEPGNTHDWKPVPEGGPAEEGAVCGDKPCPVQTPAAPTTAKK